MVPDHTCFSFCGHWWLLNPGSQPSRSATCVSCLIGVYDYRGPHRSVQCAALLISVWGTYIGTIGRYVAVDVAVSLVGLHAFMSSRLEQGNALLYDPLFLSYTRSQDFRWLQNLAAGVVTRIRNHDHAHIYPVLNSLHCLPVESTIQYKVLLLTFKSLHGRASSTIHFWTLQPWSPSGQPWSPSGQPWSPSGQPWSPSGNPRPADHNTY